MKNGNGDCLWSNQQNWGFAIKPTAAPVEEFEIGTNPQGFQLSQNHPNPFNSETKISYHLPASRQTYLVKLKICDLWGRLLKVLVVENKTPGFHSVVWNGTDDFGNAVPSGAYVYVLGIGDFNNSKKLVLMR